MLFIAEIGLNHNGNFDLACEMIRHAKISGADIVKMQLGWKGNEHEINYMNHDTLNKLFRYAAFMDIEIMFSIFTDSAFDTIKQYNVKRYKVASRTVKENFPLVKKIVNDGKETFVSLGMWEESELPLPESDNVKYLWCRSLYPTFPWDMSGFPRDFKDSVFSGYSDHTLGIETALISISRGATIVEKHFTLDKSDTTIRDHSISATPDEFREMVDIGRMISKQIEIGV